MYSINSNNLGRPCVQTSKTSSLYLHHSKGFKAPPNLAFSSINPIAKSALVHAFLGPMAVPCFCTKSLKIDNYNLAQSSATRYPPQPPRGKSRTRKRRFTRNRPFRNALIKKHSSRQASSPQGNDEKLPDLHPINLTTCDLSDAERFALRRRMLTGRKLLMIWIIFTDAFALHGRNPDDNNHTADERLPTISSTSNWMPPKSSFPEVELFLINNVKKDIFEPTNLRRAKDNLTREARSALGIIEHCF